ncbi:major facilitator superfamily domain-containing protein [Leucosporidium creatinivorum]|uniref:Major facilitator superfamily domain-containing protein n=1 Tax=Leucosporidium creatinivorum TaxID=106004 RepID=A0A1Y2EZH2_9BASI|nr:major facilitator superfamily domain-containing protein [Leucosporidium creatinivorum]
MSLTPDSHSDKPVHGQFKENASVDAAGPLEANFDREFERKTLRKVDRRLLIILGALYAVSLIDRTNISVARVAGMARDLELGVGERYSIISAIFFAPYVVFELPSNILMRKIGCRVHLSAIVILWGAVMLGMGFIKTWEQLAVCRVLLGLLESGFFPGCVYLISCWYTRFETQKRMAVFYLTSMVISGFSQIIGYGMSLLGGTHGIAAWRWVFILFGVITIGLGIIAAFLIVDFPDKNKFLTPEQTKLMVERVQLDRGDADPDHLTVKKFLNHATDGKIWIFGLSFCFSTMPAYAFSYFLPVILAGGGYDTKTSLCLSAPPYVFAAIYTFCVAYGSDKTRMRGAFIVLSATVCMVGLFIMAFGGKLGVRYFGSFLAIAGCQANVPAVLTYQANNILSHSKRAVSSAVVIGMGGVGGIFASLVYRQKDFPKYLPGLGATIGCQGAIILMVGGLSLYFSRKNKKAEQGESIEGNPNFRYTL